MSFLTKSWGVVKALLPFLPKKPIGTFLIEKAKEVVIKTDNTLDDAFVENLKEFLRLVGWYETEKEEVERLERGE